MMIILWKWWCWVESVVSKWEDCRGWWEWTCSNSTSHNDGQVREVDGEDDDDDDYDDDDDDDDDAKVGRRDGDIDDDPLKKRQNIML